MFIVEFSQLQKEAEFHKLKHKSAVINSVRPKPCAMPTGSI